MNDSVALDKKKQSKVSKKFAKIKSSVTTATKPKQTDRGVIYVGHIPHGFYESEMRKYFKQFGKVSDVNVCRSGKSGRSQGYAFVEFQSAEVAKIVAKTMDNYLMCNRRLVVKYVPHKKQTKQFFMRTSKTKSATVLRRKQINKTRNLDISTRDHIKKCKAVVRRVRKTLNTLKSLGIEYNFKAADDAYDLNKYLSSDYVPEKKEIKADVKEEEKPDVEVKTEEIPTKKKQSRKQLSVVSIMSKKNIKKKLLKK